MMTRAFAVVLALGIVCGVSNPASAQETPSPAIAVDLNEGIYLYLSGRDDSQQYQAAIEVLTSVLDRDPQNAAALLFRALAHGELGLEELKAREGPNRLIANYNAILLLRRSMEENAEGVEDPAGEIRKIDAQIEQFKAVQSPDSKTFAAWNAALAARQRWESIQAVLSEKGNLADSHFIELRQAAMTQVQTQLAAEREHYAAMLEDIKRFLSIRQDPSVTIRLLDVMANAKIARLDETDAKHAMTLAGERGAADLRREAKRRFTLAERALRQLLASGLSDELAERTRYFLAVILFRQAIPIRAESEPYKLPSPHELSLLDESLGITKSLADAPDTERLYGAYSAYYAGLSLTYLAAAERNTDKQNQMLDEAVSYLDASLELDVLDRGDGEPQSLTNNLPSLINQQRDLIDDVRGQIGKTVQEPINDITLSLGLGLRRDTNVVLLGERTDLPRDISREKDYGLEFITAVNYTRELSPGLLFGFQGRVSQLWHADVDEFDQQTYGGTAALQYELMEKRDDFGPVHLSLQYDYDYTLLGRSAFLESHAVRPGIRVFCADRRGESNFYFRYNVRDYREPLTDKRFNRDGSYFSVGLRHDHRLKNMTDVYGTDRAWGLPNDRYFDQEDPDHPARFLEGRFVLEYGWDATDGDEFDRKAYVAEFGMGVPLPWGIDVDVAARYEWGNYAHGSLIDFHRRPRRELIQEYSLALSRAFVLEPGIQENRWRPAFDRTVMTISTHVTWTEDDANIEDQSGQAVFSYDRWVYGITVGFAFN